MGVDQNTESCFEILSIKEFPLCFNFISQRVHSDSLSSLG